MLLQCISCSYIISQMLSDIFYNAGELLSVDIMKGRISAPIYQYLFSYEAPFGFTKTMFGVSDGNWTYNNYSSAIARFTIYSLS